MLQGGAEDWFGTVVFFTQFGEVQVPDCAQGHARVTQVSLSRSPVLALAWCVWEKGWFTLTHREETPVACYIQAHQDWEEMLLVPSLPMLLQW